MWESLNVFPFKNIRQAHGRDCIPLNYFLASGLTNKHHFQHEKREKNNYKTAQVGALEKFLQQHDDVVGASILNLSIIGKNRDRLQNLEADMARVFDEINSNEPEPAEEAPAQEEPVKPDEPDDTQYDLRRTIHLPKGF